MRARGVGGVLLALLLGAAAGVGAASASRPGPEPAGVAVPIPAQSPSVPTDDPFAPDIDYPPLGTVDELDTYTTGGSPQLVSWEYAVPRDWTPYRVGKIDRPIAPDRVGDQVEVRFRPADEELVGGYSLRVKAIDNHRPPADEVLVKVADFERLYEDVDVLERTDETVFFRFRAENDTLRYNFFHWFAAPGATDATLEMSVAGREVDEPGMRALFDRFVDEARPAEG